MKPTLPGWERVLHQHRAGKGVGGDGGREKELGRPGEGWFHSLADEYVCGLSSQALLFLLHSYFFKYNFRFLRVEVMSETKASACTQTTWGQRQNVRAQSPLESGPSSSITPDGGTWGPSQYWGTHDRSSKPTLSSSAQLNAGICCQPRTMASSPLSLLAG